MDGTKVKDGLSTGLTTGTYIQNTLRNTKLKSGGGWRSLPMFLVSRLTFILQYICSKTLSKVTPTTCGQLYNKFKEENGEAWQEVLELHDLLESSEASSQTIAYHMQSFSKIKRRLINLARAKWIFSCNDSHLSTAQRGVCEAWV